MGNSIIDHQRDELDFGFIPKKELSFKRPASRLSKAFLPELESFNEDIKFVTPGGFGAYDGSKFSYLAQEDPFLWKGGPFTKTIIDKLSNDKASTNNRSDHPDRAR